MKIEDNDGEPVEPTSLEARLATHRGICDNQTQHRSMVPLLYEPGDPRRQRLRRAPNLASNRRIRRPP